jgi:ATP-dependent exoDNAse (exonuclease V) alpha subunit
VDLNKRLQELLNPGVSPKGCPFRLNDKVIQLKNSFLASAVKKEPRKIFRVNRRTMDLDELAADCDRRPAAGNQEWSADQDLKHLVCNGEIGRVIWVSEDGKKIVVQFPSPDRTVMVFRAGGKADDDTKEEAGGGGNGDAQDGPPETGCDLDLAYAVTCHKMQGSQSPIVIVALDEYPGASGQFGICDRAWLYTAISRAQKACFLVGMKHVADSICSKRFIWRRKTFLVETIRELAAKAGVELRTPREPGGPAIEALFVGQQQPIQIEEASLW